METLDYSTEKWAKKQCPLINCHKKQCKCGLEKVFLASALGDDSEGSPIAPKNGAYCNAIVVYEANGHIYIYTAEGVPVSIGIGEDGLDIIDKELATLQQEIDDLKNSPDVVDIVPTYAALQAYDTSKLGDNDIIRVLQDETHDGQSTYYRWNAATSSWTYIGAVGAYYTKDQIDALLANKQNVLTAGSNITISGDTISATDTTYTAGTGLTLTDTTFAIDTDVVATKSDLPTVNDATLTINQNGVNKGTFTANDADNVTVNLTDTTYTAGNAIDITSNVISADIYPADYFTAGATVTDTGSSVTLNKTIPAKLKSVELNGDTKQQTYSGKNLFDTSSYTVDNNQLTIIRNADGSFTVNGTSTIATNIWFTNTIILNGDYTVAQIGDKTTNQGYVNLYQDSEHTTTIAYFNTAANNHYKNFTTTQTSLSQRLSVPEGTYNNFVFRIILVKGTYDLSNIGDFEQYVGGIPAPNPDYPQDVNVVTGEQTVRILGKNLFEVADETKSSNGIDWVKSNGVCHGTGTLTDETWSNLIKEYDVNLPSGTYTFSIASPVPSPLLVEFVTYDNDGVRINYQIAAGKTSQTREFPNGLKKIGVAVVHGTIGNTYDITISDIQVEHGSTATEYEPYEEQSYTIDLDTIELCKIGDYQDYIYKSGDNWYVHKEVGNIILDGSNDENWTLQTSSSTPLENRWFEYRYLDIPMDTSYEVMNLATKIDKFATTYPSSINYTTAVEGFYVMYATGYLRVRWDMQNIQSVADFRTWLSSNELNVYYPLATSTDTKITDATLIGQLDALANANSYLDATSFVVTATGTNLPAILDVSAYRNSAKGVALRPDIVGEGQTMVELTADMYNWNSSSQTATEPYDSIALWLLDVGAYEYTDINIPVYKASHIQLSATGLVWVTPPQAGTGFIGVISLSTDSSEITYSFDLASDGTLFSQYVYTDRDSMLASVKLNIVNIQTSAAPTTSDSGVIGQLWVYVDGNSDPHLYICTEIDTGVEPTEYIWEELQSGGGVTPVQTTGTSTTDVMSQDATTKLVYPDIANNPYKMVIGEGDILGTNKGVAINGVLNPGITSGSIAIGTPYGNYAQIGQNGRADQSIAIGNSAGAGRGMYSVAIGANAYTNSGQNTGDNIALGANTYAGNGTATSTVALGAYAKTTRTGEVNIGTGTNGTGYNSTNYRVLGGVHDGQLAQDAATVAQVNATIDAINTALSTNIPHIGA